MWNSCEYKCFNCEVGFGDSDKFWEHVNNSVCKSEKMASSKYIGTSNDLLDNTYAWSSPHSNKIDYDFATDFDSVFEYDVKRKGNFHSPANHLHNEVQFPSYVETTNKSNLSGSKKKKQTSQLVMNQPPQIDNGLNQSLLKPMSGVQSDLCRLVCKDCKLEFKTKNELTSHMSSSWHSRVTSATPDIPTACMSNRQSKDPFSKIQSNPLNYGSGEVSSASSFITNKVMVEEIARKVFRDEISNTVRQELIRLISSLGDNSSLPPSKNPPKEAKLPTSPQKSNALNYFCNICNVSVNSQSLMVSHLLGKKHKSALTAANNCIAK